MASGKLSGDTFLMPLLRWKAHRSCRNASCSVASLVKTCLPVLKLYGDDSKAFM